MSKVNVIAILAMALMGFNGVVKAEGYNIKPGMWETTYKIEMVGVPPQMAAMMKNKQPKTDRKCIKDTDINFTPKDMGKECSFDSTRHSAGKVSWDIKCSGAGGESTGHGEAKYNGTTMNGWFEMNIQAGPGTTMKIRNTFEGKRVGSC